MVNIIVSMLDYSVRNDTLTLQLLLPGIESIRAILLDWSKMSQHLHKLQEINSIVSTFLEKGIHYPLAERIYRQFWNSEKVLSTESPTIATI